MEVRAMKIRKHTLKRASAILERPSTLYPAELRCLSAVAMKADASGFCYKSAEVIGDAFNVKARRAQRLIVQLTEKKCLEKTERGIMITPAGVKELENG